MLYKNPEFTCFFSHSRCQGVIHHYDKGILSLCLFLDYKAKVAAVLSSCEIVILAQLTLCEQIVLVQYKMFFHQ